MCKEPSRSLPRPAEGEVKLEEERGGDFTKELGSYRVQAHGLDLHNPGR